LWCNLGRKKVYSAVVVDVHHTPPSGYLVKEIVDVLDSEPIITPQQLLLWKWIASYYMAYPGDIMKAALPAGMKLESETRIHLDCEEEDTENLGEEERQALKLVAQKKNVTVQDWLRS